MIRLFVYGTLKEGFKRDSLIAGASTIRRAVVRGRLHDGPGFPWLTVPVDTVRAFGCSDPAIDADVQERSEFRGGLVPFWPRRDRDRCFEYARNYKVRESGGDGDDYVFGDIVEFDGDFDERIRAIDQVEGFRPGVDCLYRRDLVSATYEVGGNAAAAGVRSTPSSIQIRAVAAWVYHFEG